MSGPLDGWSGSFVAALILLGCTTACGTTSDTIAVPRAELETTLDAGTLCAGPFAASDGVVALYTFDEDEGRTQVVDVVAGHDGTVQLGIATTVDGPEGCDRAFSFGASGQYIVIDDSPSFDIEVGSIDFWLWLPEELPDHVGVLSRDLSYRNEPGHLSVFVDTEGRVIARVQPEDASGDNTNDAVSCSAASLPREQWVHVGVNFGAPAVELYVNGEPQQGEGPHAITDEWSCAQPGAFGIAGNDLPWVIGRSSFRSDDVLETLEFPALGSAIDHLRISNERRDFAAILAGRGQ